MVAVQALEAMCVKMQAKDQSEVLVDGLQHLMIAAGEIEDGCDGGMVGFDQ